MFTIVTFLTMHKLQENMLTIIEKIIKKYRITFDGLVELSFYNMWFSLVASYHIRYERCLWEGFIKLKYQNG